MGTMHRSSTFSRAEALAAAAELRIQQAKIADSIAKLEAYAGAKARIIQLVPRDELRKLYASQPAPPSQPLAA